MGGGGVAFDLQGLENELHLENGLPVIQWGFLQGETAKINQT